ncbi:MAG: hypothetical protein WEE64_03845 [Dehalococcoidia bacterium]
MKEGIGPDLAAIDALLRRAADAISYPPTPAVAPAVASRLAEPATERAMPRARFGETARDWLAVPAIRIGVAGLAAALFAAAIIVAVPDSRTAVADFFGLRHVEVRIQTAPVPVETAVVRGPEAYADRTTLAEAQTLVDFPLRLPTYPAGTGAPSAVYVQRFPSDIVVILQYEEEGFELHQSRLRGKFIKGVPEGLSEVTVAGEPALWVPLGGHGAAYEDENGEEIDASVRNVHRPTLLWERDGITYRLETELSFAETIRVAESLR